MLLAVLQWQGAVWVGLFATSKTIQTARNVHTSGFIFALQKLPQGKGNCNFCKQIRQAQQEHERQQRQNQTVLEQLQMMNIVLEPRAITIFAQPLALQLLPVINPSWNSRTERPPTPPPRAA